MAIREIIALIVSKGNVCIFAQEIQIEPAAVKCHFSI